jgi:TolB-like protein
VRAKFSAQWLIDAETDARLWAKRFDRDTSDLLALQDEATNWLANALGLVDRCGGRPADQAS